jgi:DNA-binding NtrC family response regulator
MNAPEETIANELPERPVVVCVDDEAAILASLQRLLRKESYEFLTTQNPGEAMDWILQKKARLVIADQRMPSISGLELLELVKVCSPRTIRVMLTGQSDLTGVMKLNKIDAIEHLIRKPWDVEELKGIIRELLSRRDGQMNGNSPTEA